MNPPIFPMLWNDTFNTGVAEIDEQHMILVHTLNEANSKLKKDNSIKNLEQITQDLLSYALYHFETEEELMHKYGYQEEDYLLAKQHLEQHRSFSEKVVTVRDGLKSETPISADELLDFLINWLLNHILKTDMKLATFINEKRINMTSG